MQSTLRVGPPLSKEKPLEMTRITGKRPRHRARRHRRSPSPTSSASDSDSSSYSPSHVNKKLPLPTKNNRHRRNSLPSTDSSVVQAASVDTEYQEWPFQGLLKRAKIGGQLSYRVEFSLDFSRQDAPLTGPLQPNSSRLPKGAAPNKRPARAACKNSKFTLEEEEILVDLKENQGLAWKDIKLRFPKRSLGSLQVRYSTDRLYVNGDLGQPTSPLIVRGLTSKVPGLYWSQDTTCSRTRARCEIASTTQAALLCTIIREGYIAECWSRGSEAPRGNRLMSLGEWMTLMR